MFRPFRFRAPVATVPAIVGLAILLCSGPALLRAQDDSAGAASGSPKLVEQKSSEHSDRKLNAQETRGEGFFLQRCSLCHLPRNLKFGSPAVVGPILSGQFKQAGAEQMKALREYILKGGPGMPGFQYGLEPREVDDLIAFLRTL